MLHETKIYTTNSSGGVQTDEIHSITIRLDQVIGFYDSTTSFNGERRDSLVVVMSGGYDLMTVDTYEKFSTLYKQFISGVIYRKN